MGNQAPKTRILVVEDEIVVSEDLQQRLVALGYEVAGAADTADEAIGLAARVRPDVALMDIMLHGRPEGIDAAERLRGEMGIPVIYLTAHSDSATLQRARLTDPEGYIVKPFDDTQLKVAIEMAPLRHEMERKARRVARWLTATFASIGDAVIATDVRGKITLLNPAAEKLTGWNMEQARGKPCGEVVRISNRRTGQAVEDPATLALRQGLVVHLDRHSVLESRNGDVRDVDDSASPIADEDGTILGAVLVLVDATDRLASQNRVDALTREVANLLAEKDQHALLGAELEAFAAAVSHDLRAPLRAIAGFSDLLATSHHERLDATGQHFLERVRTNAQQMSSMVDDYLSFLASTHKQPSGMSAVDVGRLAREVFENLAASEQTPVRFTCKVLPLAWGDEAMLRQALINLIGNALKYSSRRDVRVVEVGAMTGEAFNTYFVQDNGAGLDLDSAAKLFEPFQRFHSATEFPGTGVGLAIVKRIIERHGGRIWAESVPGAGATFRFTLPVVPQVATQPA